MIDWADSTICIRQLHTSLENSLNEERYKDASVTIKLMQSELELLMAFLANKSKADPVR